MQGMSDDNSHKTPMSHHENWTGPPFLLFFCPEHCTLIRVTRVVGFLILETCPSVDLYFFIENQVVNIKFDELDFYPTKINFEIGYTGSKNQVQNTICVSQILTIHKAKN